MESPLFGLRNQGYVPLGFYEPQTLSSAEAPAVISTKIKKKNGKRAGDEGKREKAAAFLPLFPLPIVRRVRSISLFPIFLLRGFCGGERAKEVT